LANLLQKVGWEKANVVGLSLGGGIVTSFTAFYPEMVKRLVLLAPAGLMGPDDVPLYGKIAKLPIIRNIIVHPYFKPVAQAAIEKFARDAKTTSISSGQENDITVTVGNIAVYQFKHHPGIFRAFLGTVVNYPLGGLNKRYEQVGTQPERPVLLVWGDKDIVSRGCIWEKGRWKKMYLGCINNIFLLLFIHLFCRLFITQMQKHCCHLYLTPSWLPLKVEHTISY
jgi:pimeloyl-ACP methyl ester carboxylesterase